MKIITLLFLLLFHLHSACQVFDRAKLDSLSKNAQSKKERKAVWKNFDSTIKANIIGKWQSNNKIMHFKDNHDLLIGFGDTLTENWRWRVKGGFIMIERNQPMGSSGLNFSETKNLIVLSTSPKTLEYYFPVHEKYFTLTKISN